MEPRKGIAFICLAFAFAIVTFLVSQRMVSNWFILLDIGMAIVIVLLSVNLLLHKSNRTK